MAAEDPEPTGTATNVDTNSEGGVTFPAASASASTSSEEGGSSPIPTGSTQDEDFTCEPGVVPPELDRSCDTAEDCTVVFFTLGCGCSSLALAYNVAERDRLLTYVSSCVNTRICDCPGSLPETDSGEFVTTLDEVIAECVEGTCKSQRATPP